MGLAGLIYLLIYWIVIRSVRIEIGRRCTIDRC